MTTVFVNVIQRMKRKKWYEIKKIKHQKACRSWLFYGNCYCLLWDVCLNHYKMSLSFSSNCFWFRRCLIAKSFRSGSLSHSCNIERVNSSKSLTILTDSDLSDIKKEKVGKYKSQVGWKTEKKYGISAYTLRPYRNPLVLLQSEAMNLANLSCLSVNHKKYHNFSLVLTQNLVNRIIRFTD